MKRQIEICYGNSAKINKGNYEQESPLYSLKTTITPTASETVDEAKEYQRLKSIVEPLLQEHVRNAKLNLSNLRIRVKDGVRCVSVTSIMNPDPLPIDPVLLTKYQARGIEIEKIMKHKIKTDVWIEPETDISPLKWTDIKYIEFWEKYQDEIDWKKAQFNVEIYNLATHLTYSGEIDCLVETPDGLAVLDFKTGSYSFEQVVAYAKAIPEMQPSIVGFCDLKKAELKTKLLADCLPHWESFLIKRGIVKARFDI